MVLKLAVSWIPGQLEGLATMQDSQAEVQPVLGGHLKTPVRFLITSSKGGLAFLTEQLSLGAHTPRQEAPFSSGNRPRYLPQGKERFITRTAMKVKYQPGYHSNAFAEFRVESGTGWCF